MGRKIGQASISVVEQEPLNPIWWSAAAILAALCLAGAGLYWLFGAAVAFAFVGMTFALLWLRDQRHVSTLWRWIESEGARLPIAANGTWDELLARLYRQSRDHRREQAALSDALTSFRRAAQALPDGVVMLNAQNQILWCNPQAEGHFNLKLEADAGQGITNLLRTPDFLTYLARHQWDQPIDLRMRYGGPSPDRILSVQLVSYGDAQKLLLSRDTTKIERLETMRRDFVANVSHELKTPLTVLAGFLETIREVKLPARQQERYVELMSEQAERMQHLVADLLTLSALEADANPVDESVDMSMLLEHVRSAAIELSKGRHEIVFECSDELHLLGSESEITSALTNLVTNAIRYTPDGGRIYASWSPVSSEAGTDGEFSVSDTGIGIPAQHLPRLTERFYRVDRGRSRESGGTGLGLAIVKHVLTRHQAQLKISSTVGLGSRFTAVFPASRVVVRGLSAARDESPSELEAIRQA